MSAPLGYSFSCVPECLAELTPASAWTWAERLYASGAARRLSGAGGPGSFGTDLDRMADTLFRFGYRTERWSGEGERMFDAPTHAAFLAALAHRSARTVNRHRVAPVRPELPDRHPPVAPEPARLNLAAWCRRFRGPWLVVVEVPGGTHALAVADGRIAAGGQGHESRPVTVAFQLT